VTDGRTDGHCMLAIAALCIVSHGKNATVAILTDRQTDRQTATCQLMIVSVQCYGTATRQIVNYR